MRTPSDLTLQPAYARLAAPRSPALGTVAPEHRRPLSMAMKPSDALVNVLWIPAGLSCDRDSVALGALPALPPVKFHWPLIEYSLGGAEFLKAFFAAERGELDPFVLVIEGSIANESIKKEGYWTGFGNEPGGDQPITFSGWIDRLAPKAYAVLAAGTCAPYG